MWPASLVNRLPSHLGAKMAEFRSSLIVIDDYGLPYELAFPLFYYSDILKRELVVPKGFITDLASIPIGVRELIPKSGRYDRAAVIHDFLYQFNGCTRSEADAVLNEAMGALEVNDFRKRLIYAGVRVGGWHSWNKYRSLETKDTDGKS